MVTFKAVDGSTVALSGDLDFRFDPTTFAVWRVDEHDHLFGAGNLSFGREYAMDIGVGEFDEAYEVQGGNLFVGSWTSIDSPDGRFRSNRVLGVWEGTSHSFWTTFPDESSDHLIGLINSFAIDDQRSGLILTPRDSSTTLRAGGVLNPHALYLIPGFALLEISGLDKIRISSLPDWPGAQVDGGELFQMEPIEMNQGGSYIPFVLVTDTAWVYISSVPEASESHVIDVASGLQAQWKSAA